MEEFGPQKDRKAFQNADVEGGYREIFKTKKRKEGKESYSGISADPVGNDCQVCCLKAKGGE